jgi:hypothetical protein
METCRCGPISSTKPRKIGIGSGVRSRIKWTGSTVFRISTAVVRGVVSGKKNQSSRRRKTVSQEASYMKNKLRELLQDTIEKMPPPPPPQLLEVCRQVELVFDRNFPKYDTDRDFGCFGVLCYLLKKTMDRIELKQ